MKKKSLFLGILLGGVTAGIATLLSAPSSGKEMRKRVKDNKDSLMEQLTILKANLADLKDTVKHATTEGKEGISVFLEDIKGSVATWQQEVEPHQIKIKDELESIEQAVKDLESQIGPKDEQAQQ